MICVRMTPDQGPDQNTTLIKVEGVEYHTGLLHKMKRDYKKKVEDGFASLQDKQAGRSAKICLFLSAGTCLIKGLISAYSFQGLPTGGFGQCACSRWHGEGIILQD